MSASPKGSLLPLVAILGVVAIAVVVIVAATGGSKRARAVAAPAPAAAPVASVKAEAEAEAAARAAREQDATQREQELQDQQQQHADAVTSSEAAGDAKRGNLRALWSDVAEEEKPAAAFPSLLATADDVDEQLARAYTYDNIQESLLQTREGVRSRPAWSRFGERANPEIWEAHMNGVRAEIEASGQTFDEFAESAWAPIPEQMAAVWQEARAGAGAGAKPKASSGRGGSARTAEVPRHARNEAAGLVQEAMQGIPLGGETAAALARMSEVLSARKRAKSLGITLPEAPQAQVAALDAWAQHADATVAGTARAITSLLA